MLRPRDQMALENVSSFQYLMNKGYHTHTKMAIQKKKKKWPLQKKKKKKNTELSLFKYHTMGPNGPWNYWNLFRPLLQLLLVYLKIWDTNKPILKNFGNICLILYTQNRIDLFVCLFVILTSIFRGIVIICGAADTVWTITQLTRTR